MSETIKSYNNTKPKLDQKYTQKRQNTYDLMYFFTILYLFIDYGRPQDILPIGFLRPAMIVILILLVFVISKFKISNI